jgi:hypothetical protein
MTPCRAVPFLRPYSIPQFFLPSRSSIGFLGSLPPLPNWLLQSRQDAQREEPEPPPLSFCSGRPLDSMGLGRGWGLDDPGGEHRPSGVRGAHASARTYGPVRRKNGRTTILHVFDRPSSEPAVPSWHATRPLRYYLWVCCLDAMLPLTTIVRASIRHFEACCTVPSACVP